MLYRVKILYLFELCFLRNLFPCRILLLMLYLLHCYMINHLDQVNYRLHPDILFRMIVLLNYVLFGWFYLFYFLRMNYLYFDFCFDFEFRFENYFLCSFEMNSFLHDFHYFEFHRLRFEISFLFLIWFYFLSYFLTN